MNLRLFDGGNLRRAKVSFYYNGSEEDHEYSVLTGVRQLPVILDFCFEYVDDYIIIENIFFMVFIKSSKN